VKLVLDTNIMVSAFINPEGKPSIILKMILSRRLELVYNAAILSEYENVLLRPKFSNKINSEDIRKLINLIKTLGYSFDPVPSKIKFLDESDRIFYDTANESGSILITGNIKHFPKKSFIMIPADFLQDIKQL